MHAHGYYTGCMYKHRRCNPPKRIEMAMIQAVAEFLANAKSLTHFDIHHKVFKDMTYKFSKNKDKIILKKYNPDTSRKEIILTKRRTTF